MSMNTPQTWRRSSHCWRVPSIRYCQRRGLDMKVPVVRPWALWRGIGWWSYNGRTKVSPLNGDPCLHSYSLLRSHPEDSRMARSPRRQQQAEVSFCPVAPLHGANTHSDCNLECLVVVVC